MPLNKETKPKFTIRLFLSYPNFHDNKIISNMFNLLFFVKLALQKIGLKFFQFWYW